MPTAQSEMNLQLVPLGTKSTRSGSFAFVDPSLLVKEGMTLRDIPCTMTRDTKRWVLSLHMHRRGKHIDIDHVSNGVKRRLFSVDWQEDFALHPPE